MNNYYRKIIWSYVLFPFLMVLFLVISLEFTLNIYGSIKVMNSDFDPGTYINRDEVYTDDGNYYSVYKDGYGNTLYRVDYFFDKYGRRISHNPEDNTIADNHLLIFGGSYGFGDELFYEDTTTHYLDENLTDYNIYNYARRGYGMNNMYSQIKNSDLYNEVPEKSGYLVYVYIDHHVRRAIGDSSVLMGDGWAVGLPHYELVNNSLVEYGNMIERQPLTNIYRFISHSNIGRTFNINLPVDSTYQIQLAAELILQSKYEYLRNFPNGKFLVYLHPMREGWYTEEMIAMFNTMGIDYIYTEPFTNHSDKYIINVNDITLTHPNAEVNALVGQEIIDYINNQLSL